MMRTLLLAMLLAAPALLQDAHAQAPPESQAPARQLFVPDAYAREPHPREHCLVGAWKFTDGPSAGTVMDVSTASGGGLRWRKFDGATGELIGEEPDWQSMRGW